MTCTPSRPQFSHLKVQQITPFASVSLLNSISMFNLLNRVSELTRTSSQAWALNGQNLVVSYDAPTGAMICADLVRVTLGSSCRLHTSPIQSCRRVYVQYFFVQLHSHWVCCGRHFRGTKE